MLALEFGKGRMTCYDGKDGGVALPLEDPVTFGIAVIA
jgi:hypothetical protein